MFFYNDSLLRLRRTTTIIYSFDFLGSSTAMVVYGSGLLWPLLSLRVQSFTASFFYTVRPFKGSRLLRFNSSTATVLLLHFIKDKLQQFCMISLFMYKWFISTSAKRLALHNTFANCNSYACWPLTFPAFQQNIILQCV